MGKKINPETYELYHQQIVAKYSKEDKAAEKASESVEKAAQNTTKAVEKVTDTTTKATNTAVKNTNAVTDATKAVNESVKATEEAVEKAESTVIRKNDVVYKYFIGLSQMTEEARDKEFRDLSFNHQMGYISEQQYYEDLAELRDKHFDEGSEEWQKYTLQIHKYQNELIDKEFGDLSFNYKMGDISEQQYYEDLANLRDKYFEEGSEEWQKYTLQILKYQDELVDRKFGDLTFNYKMGYISEQQYYEDLAGLRDKYFEEGSKEWQKYTLQIHKYQIDLIDQQKKDIINLYDEISKEATTAINNLEKKHNNLTKRLSDATPLATKYKSIFVDQGEGMVLENGIWKNHKDYITEEYRVTDLDAEIKKLSEIYDAISAVKSKGISSEFFDIFTNLTPDDMLGTANAILALSDEDFKKFYSSWKNFQEATNTTAYMMTEQDRTAIIDEYGSLGDDLKQSLTEAFGTIPENFYEYGMLSADEFGKGFSSRINTTMAFMTDGTSVNDSFTSTGNTSNTYNFYGSDKTDTERLIEVKRYNEISQMRGE